MSRLSFTSFNHVCPLHECGMHPDVSWCIHNKGHRPSDPFDPMRKPMRWHWDFLRPSLSILLLDLCHLSANDFFQRALGKFETEKRSPTSQDVGSRSLNPGCWNRVCSKRLWCSNWFRVLFRHLHSYLQCMLLSSSFLKNSDTCKICASL